MDRCIVKETDLKIFLNKKYDSTIKMCMIGKSGSGKTRLLTNILIPILYKEYKFIYLLYGIKYLFSPYSNLIHENHQFYCNTVDDINNAMTYIKNYAEYLNTSKVSDTLPETHRKILIICDDLGDIGSKSVKLDDCFIKHRHLGIGIIILGQKYTFFSTIARSNSSHFSFSSLEDIENMIGKTYKLNFPYKTVNEIYLRYNDNKIQNNIILHLDDNSSNRISTINKDSIPTDNNINILSKTYSKINYATKNKCNECNNKYICKHVYNNKSITFMINSK